MTRRSQTPLVFLLIVTSQVMSGVVFQLDTVSDVLTKQANSSNDRHKPGPRGRPPV